MAIEQNAIICPFYEYAVNYAIELPNEEWPDTFEDLDPHSMLIPPYQRKIVWREKEIKEFLDSGSSLFGTVIFGSIEGKDRILLDGLQRFAIATAILNRLCPLVLSPNSSKEDIAKNFKKLADMVYPRRAVFEYNHNMLQKHTRIGIQISYDRLYKDVESVIDEKLNTEDLDIQEFAEKIFKTFVRKQISIQSYSNFKNNTDLTQTFININSTGISLSDVDLLRSEIIQKAEELVWSHEDIDDIENKFNRVFDTKTKWTNVLGKNLYDVQFKSKNDNNHNKNLIFRDWDNLKKEDVEELLKFIEEIGEASKEVEGKESHPYIYEIFQCGTLPMSLITWFFLKKMQDGRSDVLKNQQDCKELHILLRVFYRCMIDHKIGRIGPNVIKFMNKDPAKTTLLEFAKEINPVGTDIDKPPSKDWLIPNLKKANSNNARSIFNACLLPPRNSTDHSFKPLIYGLAQKKSYIDYLIPHIDKNTDEINKIVNLAPVHAGVDKKVRKNPCYEKLKSNGIYNSIIDPHPYVKWLITDHYEQYKNKKDADGEFCLNIQKYLMNDADPPIGHDRINKIAELLADKL